MSAVCSYRFNRDSVWFGRQYSDLEVRYQGVHLSNSKILPQYAWLARLIFFFFRTVISSPPHVVFSVTIQKTLQWLLGKMEITMLWICPTVASEGIGSSNTELNKITTVILQQIFSKDLPEQVLMVGWQLQKSKWATSEHWSYGGEKVGKASGISSSMLYSSYLSQKWAMGLGYQDQRQPRIRITLISSIVFNLIKLKDYLGVKNIEYCSTEFD